MNSADHITKSESPSQDKKKSNLATRSSEHDCESISSNTVKRVRFSEYIDYCDFDNLENDITATETEVSSIKSEINELASDIVSLDISSSVNEVENKDHKDCENSVIVTDEFEKPEEGDFPNEVILPLKPCSERSNQKHRSSKFVNQRQTKRINDILRKRSNNFRAEDVKAVVFKAWTDVKRKTNEHQPFVPSEPDNVPIEKSNIAYIEWKNLKDKELKCVKKVEEQSVNSKNIQDHEKNKEENEMVFLTWKKRKDSILKQEALKKRKDERNAAEIALMNKEEKRRDGECAYLAWKAHKEQTKKEEKFRRLFYKESENQEIREKESRSIEAQNMYDLWIEYKFSKRRKSKESSYSIKIPWYPPGN